MPMLFWFLGCQFVSGPPAESEGLRTDRPPVVALVTIDTWRADFLTAEHAPNVWQLAEQGERYDNAYSPMGLTTPAHATMLTGLDPWSHGAQANNHHGYALKADVPVLPDSFDDWATAAFVSAYPAGPEGGMRRGWDVFDGPEAGERSGQVAVQRALEWLPDDRPALLWVHVYEPHGPYEGRGSTERARYGEEVQRADAVLAPLFKVLKARGARIVVTADHGEVLDEERCSYQHERTISDHVLRVPLVRWAPDVEPAVHDGLVGLVDVPALLRGESIEPRPYLLAQSGMCESDCAPGCMPDGLAGRDAVVITNSGKWVRRPGRGELTVGSPDTDHRTELEAVPALSPPTDEANDRAASLGYVDP